MPVTRIFDLLPRYANKMAAKDDVLCGKEDGEWKKYNIYQYIEIVNDISFGFLKLGVQKGQKIATITNNRPEWNFLDMAIQQVGAIHVPIYPTISESDYEFILNHAEVVYVFVSGEELYRKIQNVIANVESLRDIYTFNNSVGIKHLSELIELGKSNPNSEKLEEIKSSIKTDDLATLIYTSGTTGDPKGVMLSHKNILSNVMSIKHVSPVGEEGKALSYLPLSHVYERTLNYMYQYLGTSIYYAENLGKIVDNIQEIRPHIMGSVPRLLEKVYDKIMAKGRKQEGIKKKIFFWAMDIGLKYEVEKSNPIYKVQLAIARKLVFSKWKEAMGGNFKVIVSGAAALQTRLAKVFWAAGIPLLEGYGLTETSPVLAVNSFLKGGLCFGTVGKIVPDVDIKIGDDGEILAKGPNLMKGYYKQQDLTAEVINKDGYFHTGDIGIITEAGHLKITGRKKEIFKTSMGKYISPQLIENKFKESSFIDQIAVIGENQKFAAALVVPDFAYLKSFCILKKIEYISDTEIVKNPEIKKQIHQEIESFNKAFGDTEKIKKFELIDHEWSIETGELTASLKMRRKFIYEKYEDLINKIFNIVPELEAV
ncbi:MAG: long-chain fatty acid--CoA ligase [Saprospiraceae bacterium]|nr:long-chain fatty acid--CoA ligase [Saprospiraceae bacterium]